MTTKKQAPPEGGPALSEEQIVTYLDIYRNDMERVGDFEAFRGVACDIWDAALAAQPTRSQLLADAGYTRRPSWKSLPGAIDGDEAAPSPAEGADNCEPSDKARIAMLEALVADRDKSLSKLRAAVEADWQHLKPYGYAPGNYLSRCLKCNTVAHDVDKRATTCRPCAEAMHSAASNVQPKGLDTARLDFIQANPTLTLRHHKRHWSLVGFTNYEYRVFKTVREAIDHAMNGGKDD